MIHAANGITEQSFTRTETDLTVTLDSHVFNLVRQYDSLNASTVNGQSSFGNGWRLANRDVNHETDVPPTGREEFGVVNSFRVGTRLYLTLPAGERVG